MKHLIKIALCAVASTALLTPASYAMSAGWSSSTGENSEQIHAQTSDNTSIAFVCAGGKLMSAIATDSTNSENIIKSFAESRRKSSKKVTLYINGEAVNKSTWSLSPGTNVIVPNKSIVAAKLYNAAIRGDKVSFKRSGRDSVDLTLPATNSDFVNFGGACGVGANKAMKAEKKVEQSPPKQKPKKIKPPAF